MKIIDKMKEKAKNLKKEITAINYAYQNPEVKLLPRIIIIFTIGYALSPIDLIPDFIPILGYLDDLIIIPALITLSIKLIPKEIMDESREKALKEPLKLKKNWFFALLFIFIWVTLLTVIVLAIIRLFTE
ncbi:MAG: DUF1232 domain-containing protein [Syntrophaceae bacterium]|nr:DUF1232 domain-containing protein [Syntrophaceae bacterium]